MRVGKVAIYLVCIIFMADMVALAAGIDEGNDPQACSWTLMFYDDADFSDAYDPLIQFSEEAFSGENLSVLVLQDTWCKPAKLWYIDRNHRMKLLRDLGEVNMGDYNTLRYFIDYCKENFPADRYMMLIYNHGMGWKGVCLDDTDNDTLTMDELQRALMEGDGVDIICFTGPCLMGNVEAAYELRNCTDIYIGSEETSGYMWWKNVIKSICEILNTNPNVSSLDLGKMIIKSIEEQSHLWTKERSNLTMSAIRTDKLNELKDAIDRLSIDFLRDFDTSYNSLCSVYKEIQSFGWGSFLVDLYDFIERYMDIEKNRTTRRDLQSVLEILNDTVIAEIHGKNKIGAHGLSIYLPDPTFSIYDTKYSRPECGLDFAKDTHWDDFLREYLEIYSSIYEE